MKATYKGNIIADSDSTIVIEGNHYFPAGDVYMEYLSQSDHESTCPWKGQANYYNVTAGGSVAENAAWYYRNPKPEAAEIAGHVAFWGDITVAE